MKFSSFEAELRFTNLIKGKGLINLLKSFSRRFLERITNIMKKIKQPLEGINVLDLTRVLAGPTSTQLLEISSQHFKIERPISGDDSRNLGPPYSIKTQKSQKKVLIF